MSWISFKEKNPIQGEFLITRSSGMDGKGSCFEDWMDWENIYLKITPNPPTHWWDGELHFEMAVKAWDSK